MASNSRQQPLFDGEKKSNLSFLEKCLAQNLCYLFPSTTQVKALSFLRASPIIVKVGITSACISLFSQQQQQFRAKCNYLFTVKCVAVGIIVAIIDSPRFGLPLSHFCGYFYWLPNEVVMHQHNRHSINSNFTKTNKKNKNKTTIITTLLILPLLLRINNNIKCWRLNHERSNTFTLKLKLILPVPVWKSHS